MVRALMTFRIYMITGYVLALILMGYICFKYLFPMLGQWIVDLNCKMQNRILKLKADEDKWKQNVREQFEEDVAMQMEQPEEPRTEEFFATESQIAKVLSKKPKSTYEKRWVQEEQDEKD